MDSDNATFDMNSQYSTVCPLCQSEIKLFFINLNEKLLMCENVECEYPFGYEDLQFFKENKNAESVDELCSIRSKPTITDNTSMTCSVVSATAWLEIDRMNTVFESEDSQSEYIPKTNKSKSNEKQKEKEEKVLNNVECIKGLNKQLKEINGSHKRKIANKKYIKNLMTLQTMTGVEMLQPEEINILNKDKINEATDFKIDVNMNAENSVSSIKIELIDITSQEKAGKDKKDDSNES
ncbi:uncharacterized protein LOC106140838 isoform X2 [Amyelois transitella]|uniref:uncharacterized protein LOC106140838 isoform X2 n=1 Tax=Amyelois transitella TaxID=680683 RepID=UPI00067BE31D|nr:uncharacterized protein LOC106140838 isoform X2 [Amyelois transitella]